MYTVFFRWIQIFPNLLIYLTGKLDNFYDVFENGHKFNFDLTMDQNAMIIDVNNFFTKNQAKYDVFINFKEKLLNLSHDTFNDLINYVQSNKEIIFKDHKNALFFYFNVALESEYNFKTFELYLDVCIYFQENIP